jgi:uncharacterized iron-regulated protein
LRRLASLSVLLGSLAACARHPRPALAPAAPGSLATRSPESIRALRSSNGTAISIDEIAALAMHVGYVFFGEQHDDPESHFAEFALLDALARRGANVAVSLEMFERDVQTVVDEYLAGRITEADFLAKSRPWPNYAQDYRPLVLLARARGWPVIAANVPRAIANAVSRSGLAALDTLSPGSRAFVARDIQCAHDAYYDLFAEQMKGHSTAPGSAADTASARTMTDRYFEAQCVKDETMAESIVAAHDRATAKVLVVHFNGSFHSDYSFGTASRVLRRAPSTGHLVISAIPVANPAGDPPAGAELRGHYMILTGRPGSK